MHKHWRRLLANAGIGGARGARRVRGLPGPRTACFEALEPRVMLSAVAVLEPVAVQGDAAPGTAAGVIFGVPVGVFAPAFEAPVIDDEGQVLFVAALANNYGTTVNNPLGIWATTPLGLEKMVRLGESAPSTDESFANFTSLRAAGDGHFLFSSTLVNDQGQHESLYKGNIAGSLDLVMRQGDPAPGVGQSFGVASAPLLNSQGQVGFSAVLAGQLASGWIDGALVNRQLDPAPDVPGVLVFSGGGIQFLNDSGQVAFINSILFNSGDFRQIGGVWSGPPEALQLNPVLSKTDPFAPNNPVPPATIADGIGMAFSSNGLALVAYNNAGQIVLRDNPTVLRPGTFFSGLPGRIGARYNVAGREVPGRQIWKAQCLPSRLLSSFDRYHDGTRAGRTRCPR